MKNILVCTNINDESFNALKEINKVLSFTKSNLTLLHIWDKRAFDYPGDMIVPFYPNEGQA